MYAIEPWGDDWGQAALIAGTAHNAWCDEKINPADMIPTKENRQKRSSQEIDDRDLASTWTRRLHF